MRRRAQRSGFTLLEVLVVIAIIGVLIALLVPAVQMAREAANRMKCESHLRQIATAYHQHDDAHGHLPTGGWGAQWIGDPDRGFSKGQPGGWAYNILPFIEQELLHQLGGDLTDPAEQKAARTECIRTPVSLFYCPTRRAALNYPGWQFYGHPPPFNANDVSFIAKTDYAANVGDQPVVELTYPASLSEGDTTFMWEDTSMFTGIVFQRSTISMDEIGSGTSKVYLVGEKYLPPEAYTSHLSNGDHHGAYAGQSVESLRSTFIDYPPMKDTRYVDHFRRFGSAHDGGWNVALCDGSVHFISYSVDSEIHRRFGNRRDPQ